MKKTLAAITIALISTTSFAGYHCDYPMVLRVSLTNFGADNCTLEKSTLIDGSIDHIGFPAFLPASGQTTVFALTGGDVKATATYKCGEYKQFTINMRHYWKKSHRHSSIDAVMSNKKDVFETHKAKPASHGRHVHLGRLDWQIYQ
jgi:hypothetical protein